MGPLTCENTLNLTSCLDHLEEKTRSSDFLSHKSRAAKIKSTLEIKYFGSLYSEKMGSIYNTLVVHAFNCSH